MITGAKSPFHPTYDVWKVALFQFPDSFEEEWMSLMGSFYG